MKIKIKKGLDIPLSGKPEGFPQPLEDPSYIGLDLTPFEDIPFKLHAKVGDSVNIGTPLLESKQTSGLLFVSPAGGILTEIRRGAKRRLLSLVIKKDAEEKFDEQRGLSLHAQPDEIITYFLRNGLFPHIRMRPFNLMANPRILPRDIFIQGLETLPFVPSSEMQLEGKEEYFQAGLEILSKLTKGKVHLIYHEKSASPALKAALQVERHSISGPHPASSSSLHIHWISPIRHAEDVVWTLKLIDVITIGKHVKEGRYFTERVIGLGGEGFKKEKRGFYKGRMGYPISHFVENLAESSLCRLISGSPLTGTQVEKDDFLGFQDTTCSAIVENHKRELFHFFRFGKKKYTATKAYASGHMKPPKEGFSFTTSLHGEPRPFIDGDVYDKVMPMKIPTMHLIKALLSNDFELAESLGLLEVIPEDFALATFVCPSKVEMVQIVKEGLSRFAKENGY